PYTPRFRSCPAAPAAYMKKVRQLSRHCRFSGSNLGRALTARASASSTSIGLYRASPSRRSRLLVSFLREDLDYFEIQNTRSCSTSATRPARPCQSCRTAFCHLRLRNHATRRTRPSPRFDALVSEFKDKKEK